MQAPVAERCLGIRMENGEEGVGDTCSEAFLALFKLL